MTDREAMEKAVYDHPFDDTPRLVLIDLLQETMTRRTAVINANRVQREGKVDKYQQWINDNPGFCQRVRETLNAPEGTLILVVETWPRATPRVRDPQAKSIMYRAVYQRDMNRIVLTLDWCIQNHQRIQWRAPLL